MQKAFDFVGVLDTLVTKQNPEIWHAEHNTHPGLPWVIKTVVPKIEFADDDNIYIIELWHSICSSYSDIITLRPAAYDWDGNLLEEWDTVWILGGWDIELTETADGEITHAKCSVVKGANRHAEILIDKIGAQLAHLTSIEEREELLDLIEVCEAMASYSTDQDSAIMRGNIKVIDD